MATQYVAVLFNPWDRRTYTYHNDGDALAPQDEAVVVTDRGESVVTVVSVSDQKPEFATKPILRKHEPAMAGEQED